VVWVGACSGPSFTPSDCDDAECAGASSGGSANGGASQGGTSNGEGGQETGGTDMGGSNGGGTDTGGRNNGGTDAGGTNSGGTDAGGSGGSGTSGTSGVAGTDPGGFPTTPVLDDFNQDAPELGADWDGATHLYQVDSGALHCPAEYCQATFFYERFGVAQEVFATLVSFSDYSPEINLVLKAQGELDCDLMEILYAPDTQEILLEACWDGSWRTLGKVAIRVEPGAQLGARVLAEGLVEIYRNGELVETIDASDYPFIDLEGYIGVNGIVRPGEAPNIWDDFGGGTF
jgi:hypothetical protein